MKRLACLTLVAFFVVVCVARAEDSRPKTVTVPFEILKSKHIALKIKINGHGPYRVILDTGAPVSLLNTKTAKASGMVNKNAHSFFLTPFNSLGPTNINDLQIGGLDIRNSMAVVMDHPTVELISRILGPIEGLVGYPVWSRFKLTIDYQAKQMTLTPNGYKPGDPLEAMMNAVMSAADGPAVKVLGPAAQWGMVLETAAKADGAGVHVEKVLAGSAAAAAGLKAGDQLLTLDDRWTDTVADAYQAAALVKAGVTVKIRIRRDGKESELSVTPRAGL